MRRLLGLVLVLSLPAPARPADRPHSYGPAEERSRPGGLSAREAGEGWLLLFDGASTYGWQAPNGSKWTVARGMLAPQAGKPGLLVTTTAFGDYDLSLEYRARPGSRAQVLVGCGR